MIMVFNKAVNHYVFQRSFGHIQHKNCAINLVKQLFITTPTYHTILKCSPARFEYALLLAKAPKKPMTPHAPGSGLDSPGSE